MKYIKTKASIIASLLLICLFSSFALFQSKPTLFLIGDSTVKNGQDDGQKKGAAGLWGWGHYMAEYFDLSKISVENDALGGTSSRTFMNNPKLWPTVLAKIKPGDFVMMQFGHNDSSPVNDSTRARGTIKGNGEESQAIVNMITKKDEVVHSYGWYLRKLIIDAKAKGASVIVCSPIPRNAWVNGKIKRNDDDYGKWAAEAAAQGGAAFLPLNKIIADDYDAEGEAKVKSTYFNTDATHTIEAGAKFNTTAVIQGIKGLKDSKLSNYLK
ncbi:GDSL-type esterase/lipase family protein [Mucilaginibacter paludis]|uniref:Lipolytic protein G-D-S-L family n=1 Tax=Mucilaginibacter paludis DSM 18603 TaxID=714943 RepID=H1Y0W9_9SPHI|nr:GDSL-type esterase/lipase family protein [Mucilaginibacter paludis]EHQ29194.1 lipolytic protein G-D-S-L family [Mucilaginibacter paludis DSM 18603]